MSTAVAVALAEAHRARAEVDKGAGTWTIIPALDALLTALREQMETPARVLRIPPTTSRPCASCDLPEGHEGAHYRWLARREVA